MDEADPVRAALVDDPGRSAVVSDFDGTLAPIVADPAAARPLPGAVDALHELAARFGRAGVVSGRPVSFLRHRLDLDHRPASTLFVAGLYGIEWVESGRERVHDTALAFLDTVAAATRSAKDEAPPGVGVEAKRYALTLHFRNAPDHAGWVDAWADATAAATGLVAHRGRMSIELRPPLDVDKGTVVEALVAGAGAACFLGDDLGDLPAFDALDRLRASTGAATFRVAVRSAEAPVELLERADLVVDGPLGALALLRALLA